MRTNSNTSLLASLIFVHLHGVGQATLTEMTDYIRASHESWVLNPKKPARAQVKKALNWLVNNFCARKKPWEEYYTPYPSH